MWKEGMYLDFQNVLTDFHTKTILNFESERNGDQGQKPKQWKTKAVSR